MHGQQLFQVQPAQPHATERVAIRSYALVCVPILWSIAQPPPHCACDAFVIVVPSTASRFPDELREFHREKPSRLLEVRQAGFWLTEADARTLLAFSFGALLLTPHCSGNPVRRKSKDRRALEQSKSFDGLGNCKRALGNQAEAISNTILYFDWLLPSQTLNKSINDYLILAYIVHSTGTPNNNSLDYYAPWNLNSGRGTQIQEIRNKYCVAKRVGQ